MVSVAWRVVFIIVCVLFVTSSVMSFVGFKWFTVDNTINFSALLSLGVVLFLHALFSLLVPFLRLEQKKSLLLVLMFLVVSLVSFEFSFLYLVLQAIARTDCSNTTLPLHIAACSEGYRFFFALNIMWMLATVVATVAAFIFRDKLLQQAPQQPIFTGEDEKLIH